VTLRLLTYNIRYGGHGREKPLATVIASCSPDIVIFQEATRPAVVEELARTTGMRYWAAAPRQSLAFIARVEIGHYEWHRPRLSRHAFLEIVPALAPCRIFGLHLSAVHAAWTERRRTFELRALLKSIAAHQHGLHVLAGDFNTLAPGEILEARELPHRLRALVWLSGGRIRWRTIQAVLDAGYFDAFRALHPTDPGLTFPTWKPHVRLDYAFVPGAFLNRLVSCEVIRTDATASASDHHPLLTEIDVVDHTSVE
jgi:exodeoxyribonuclease-3